MTVPPQPPARRRQRHEPASRRHRLAEPRLILSVVLAASCATVLAARVYRDFEPVRIRVVRTDLLPSRGSVAVPLPDVSRLSGQPVAIVLRLHNNDPDPRTIRIALGGSELANLSVAPTRHVRVDLSLPASANLEPGDRFELSSDGDGWALSYLELANLHGFSRGLLNCVIVPRFAQSSQPVSGFAPPLLFLVLLILSMLSPARSAAHGGQAARRIHVALVVLVLVLFTVALLSPYASQFTILLSGRTFFLSVLILYFPAVQQFYARARLAADRSCPSRVLAFDGVTAVVAIAVLFTLSMLYTLDRHDGNYSGFLHFSAKTLNESPVPDERLKGTLVSYEDGYDAQFMYLMAFDPFLSRYRDAPKRYRTLADVPPYRYGRIGFSLLTKTLSGDRPERYPITMVWLVVISFVAGAISLVGIAVHYGANPLWVLLYALVPAWPPSLAFALPEPIAAAFVLTGLWAYLRSRYLLAAVCLSAALLVRETGILLILVLALWELVKNRRPGRALVIASPLAALARVRGMATFRGLRLGGAVLQPASLNRPVSRGGGSRAGHRAGRVPRVGGHDGARLSAGAGRGLRAVRCPAVEEERLA